MASYKVIQDIEAEDKLVGPLTLRQFIYAGIVALCLYLGFYIYNCTCNIFSSNSGAGGINRRIFCFPWKLNQPTETWALAMIKFSLSPGSEFGIKAELKKLSQLLRLKSRLQIILIICPRERLGVG